jgi:hypothetical protein
MKSFWVIVLLAAGLVSNLGAQTGGAAAQRGQAAGTIAALDATAKTLSIKTDAGQTVLLTVTDKSYLRRLPPGETDMKKAVPVTLGDLAAGDPIVASYQTGADQKTLEARTVLIRTKSDVAQMLQKETEDWQRRGVVGNVTAIDAAGKSFTLRAGPRTSTVQASDKTAFLRYALDSAKINDAKPASLGEIKVGDEVHVLGNKDAAGTTVTAEKVVFGSFRQIAGTIESVDPATGMLKVKDLAVKKGAPVMLKVNAETTLKKLPPQVAAMWARRYAPGRGAAAGNADAPATPEAGRGRGGMRGGGGGDIKQILDRLPATPLGELKQGDAIMVTTTEGSDSTHLTAIMVLAGVEPVLTAAPNSTRDIMSGWNLGGGGEGGGEGN